MSSNKRARVTPNRNRDDPLTIVVGTDHLGSDFGDRLRAQFTNVCIIDAMSHDSHHSCEAEHASAIADADAFLGWPSGTTVAAAKRLRWIACPGAGVDKIVQFKNIRSSDICLTNAPGTHVTAMAEHVLGSMIFLAHQFHKAEIERTKRNWDTQAWNNQIVELKGKVCGIFGYGAVGKAVASRTLAFGMPTLGSAREGTSLVSDDGVERVTSLDELCSRSRFLVIAAPITAETAGVIDQRRLKMLPRGAFVIAISRGGILDEEALADLIEDGSIAGAAIDSTAIEPLPQSSRLWTLPRVLLTPHSSALSFELFENRRKIFEDQLRLFIAGEPLQNVVDKSAGY